MIAGMRGGGGGWAVWRGCWTRRRSEEEGMAGQGRAIQCGGGGRQLVAVRERMSV